MRASAVSLILVVCCLVLADVDFIFPSAGVTIAAGTSFEIAWKDSGNAPSISDLLKSTLLLYSGSNASPVELYTLSTGELGIMSSIKVQVPPGLAGEEENAYFVGMRSEVNAGGFVENFSDRFTLSGMTGTFPAEVKKGFSDIIGTSGPATRSKIHVEIRAAADPDAAGAGAFGIPYSEQTGPTRYAPMQSIPPTSITATNTAPLFPTSSVDILSVAMGTATIQTTVTQPQTFSVASHANQAPAASQPTGDMEKFLNRWKD